MPSGNLEYRNAKSKLENKWRNRKRSWERRWRNTKKRLENKWRRTKRRMENRVAIQLTNPNYRARRARKQDVAQEVEGNQASTDLMA